MVQKSVASQWSIGASGVVIATSIGGYQPPLRVAIGTLWGGQRDPLGWSTGAIGVVNGTPWGGQRDLLGWSTGPLGVVSGSHWGGRRDLLGWSAGPFGVVGGTLRGGQRQPSGCGGAGRKGGVLCLRLPAAEHYGQAGDHQERTRWLGDDGERDVVAGASGVADGPFSACGDKCFAFGKLVADE